MTLFQLGAFTLHSGKRSMWKIDCDALTPADWEALAYIGLAKMGWPKFHQAKGIPRGGLRLARALDIYASGDANQPMLLVDDVLSTGQSMEGLNTDYPDALGLVVFARAKCPSWITPIFQM